MCLSVKVNLYMFHYKFGLSNFSLMSTSVYGSSPLLSLSPVLTNIHVILFGRCLIRIQE